MIIRREKYLKQLVEIIVEKILDNIITEGSNG